MAHDVFLLDVRDGGPDVGDAGIRDDDVEMVDAVVRFEGSDGIEGVLPDGGVDLDDDEFSAGGFGEVLQVCGGLVGRVAVGSDDGVVGQVEVTLQ